jgi:hypothetical protein
MREPWPVTGQGSRYVWLTRDYGTFQCWLLLLWQV